MDAMPAKKPSLQEVMEAVQSLNVGMGAELVSLRAEVAELNNRITKMSAGLTAVTSLEATQPPKQAPPLKFAIPLSVKEKDLALLGHKLEAISTYRLRIHALTGSTPDLLTAKLLVDDFIAEGTIKPVFDILNPPPLLPNHKQLVKRGKKIDAIKVYRAYTGTVCANAAGLKEAKDIMDAYAWKIGCCNWPPVIEFVTPPF
jgi:hypothetical protein